jgi:predicted TIM-barrel enzyme
MTPASDCAPTPSIGQRAGNLTLPGDRPLLFAATAGATADTLQDAGVDLVFAYHSSLLRAQGIASAAGMLPWGSANEMSLRILTELRNRNGRIAAGVSVCANDLLLTARTMICRARDAGAVATLNAPTVGLLTGDVRGAVEDAGLGFAREVELQTHSREQGLLPCAYAFTGAQTCALIDAGAEVVIAHLGITRHSTEQSNWRTAVSVAQDVVRAARTADPAVAVLVHGGPLTTPAHLRRLRADLGNLADRVGFFGASVFEHPGDQTPADAIRLWEEALQ